LWLKHRDALGESNFAVGCKRRGEQAMERLNALQTMREALSRNDDEAIANASQSKALEDLNPSTLFCEEYSERIKAAIARIAVIRQLDDSYKKNQYDEASFVHIASKRQDMAKSTSWNQPNISIGGMSWRDRIIKAQKLLAIRKAHDAALSEIPVNAEQIFDVWDEPLCRNHPLFEISVKNGYINNLLDLGAKLKRFRQILSTNDVNRISSEWQEAFSDYLNDQQIHLILDAMRKSRRNQGVITDIKLVLESQRLNITWTWGALIKYCMVMVNEGSFPSPPPPDKPVEVSNISARHENYPGKYEVSFRGTQPHVRIWPILQFRGHFFLGSIPAEVRLVNIEYSVEKLVFGGYRLVLIPPSETKMRIPQLRIFVSGDGVTQELNDCPIPPVEICNQMSFKLQFPSSLPRRCDLFLHLRPAQDSDAQWLHLTRRSPNAATIRL
jgi:hypothetical protein